MNIANIDRRMFLRGTGIALALPWFETFASALPSVSKPKKRLACFYVPDGVPMPRSDDPAFEDWAWFPARGRQGISFHQMFGSARTIAQ